MFFRQIESRDRLESHDQRQRHNGLLCIQHALCRTQLHSHEPVTLKVKVVLGKGQEVPVAAAALRGQAGKA